MKKRILAFTLCVLFALTIFSGCKKNDDENLIDLPITEANPDIRKPEGEFYTANGDELYASGGLSALGDNFIRIMVDKTETEFKMSDEVIRKIGIFNKDENNLQIKRGTFISLQYEIKDGKYYAKDIEIITAN